MRFDPNACADLVLNSFHNVENWQAAYEPEDIKPMRDDIRTGLAAVLRAIAETSAPGAAFELSLLADEMEPTDA